METFLSINHLTTLREWSGAACGLSIVDSVCSLPPGISHKDLMEALNNPGYGLNVFPLLEHSQYQVAKVFSLLSRLSGYREMTGSWIRKYSEELPC